MRTVLAVALLALVSAAPARSQEPAKVKVAVVRLDRVMSHENVGHDRVRLLAADKDTAEALKKIDAEVKATQKELLGVEDELKLAEMERRVQFLNRKSNLLRQRMHNDPGRNMQKLVRDFVVENYRDQYHLIAQDAGAFDRFIYKEGVEINDITEEAAEKFRQHLGAIFGD